MCALTDSVSHAVEKYPLMRVIWVISWLLSKADVMAGLDTYHREEIEGGSNRLTSGNLLTTVLHSFWMSMESLVTLTTQVNTFLELGCTSITVAQSGSLIADKAPWSI